VNFEMLGVHRCSLASSVRRGSEAARPGQTEDESSGWAVMGLDLATYRENICFLLGWAGHGLDLPSHPPCR
jgi:hypothetical protein